MDQYLLHLATMVGIYSILVYSQNLITGYGGLLLFCHASFFGTGAYAYSLLNFEATGEPLAKELLLTTDLPFFVALFGAAAAAGCVALLVSLVVLRFRGELFIFATIGFQMIFYAVIYNWAELTRGPLGIYGVARPSLLGWQVNEQWEYALLVLVISVLIVGALFVFYKAPFGLNLKALRDNERAAESLGIPGNRRYFSALLIVGVCAGFAGALFASYATYIDPSTFSLRESIFIITLLLLGGSGNTVGPIIGTVILLVLPEILRLFGIPDSISANVRQIIYGLALIILMYWRPQGLAGDYAIR